MEYAILGLLLLGDLTIYELNSAFQRSISLIYAASYGSLQSAIRKLLKKEWVVFSESVENGRNKKRYSATVEGARSFHRWMREEIPASKLEVNALARLHFLGLIDDRADRIAIVDTIIDAITGGLDRLEEQSASLSGIALPADRREVFRFQLKTLEYGIASHRAALRWFEELRSEL